MHDHDQHAAHDHGHEAASSMPHHVPGAGHNRLKAAAQWQVPHRPEGAVPPPPAERDLDLVETSFVDGFGRAPDPTSFLRLAKIPFVGVDGAGRRLHLLRVEMENMTDVGAVSPLLDGEGMRYDPLPARMVSQRSRLAFVYHDGQSLARLGFSEARALVDQSAPSHFAMTPEG
ncbi:MAG: hypothetical protein WBQ75_13375 [Acetobacteraceae bacterium]